MATNNTKTREDYQAELAALAENLINDSLFPKRRIPFVPCADLLLAQAREDPEIREFYQQYFAHLAHIIFTPKEVKAASCTELGDDKVQVNPLMDCLPPGCTTLYGIRGSVTFISSPKRNITRLFIGDLVWVYWLDRMGIFELYARLVNDYATEGKFPIDNNTITAVTLEVMVRQLQMGIASLIRDRVGTYRRCLGWTTPTGRKLELQTEVNTAFTSQFHQFINGALKYYKDLRLAEAIQQTTGGGSSAATRVAVAETLQLMKESFRVFDYGRNAYNTLSAIVYVIATLNLVRTLRDDIGIPSTYTKLSQYVSAAYAKLVEGKSSSEYQPNRYLLHLDCAEKGRDLLLDIDALDANDLDAIGSWLENKIVEERIESYRKAYRDITKIDLAESIEGIEQNV
ncbi:MAG TPA: hypothetical protein VKZ59_01925 [Acidobacteriota bacterium]|nr:hypothetical protein [Acidobacteriota bacterium]